jgi:hypothetical protein
VLHASPRASDLSDQVDAFVAVSEKIDLGAIHYE